MLSVLIKRSGLKNATSLSLLIFSGFLFTCLPSCDIINPPEQIPAYVQIDTVTFTASPGQGTSSQKITDVWFYEQENLLGAFEVPKVIPVLDSGAVSLILSPGIWDDGISEVRLAYPFFFPDTVTVNLSPSKTIHLSPHFTYRSATKFYFIEDFEAGNLLSKINGDTNLVRSNVAGEVFEGNYSGAIYLDHDRGVYEGRSNNSYNFTSGQPVYLEMNYKCDQPFQVGLYGTQVGASVYYYKWTINAKDYWNKIYLDMGNDIGQLQATNYQVLVRAVFDSTRESSKILIDNLKLVSF